MSHTGQGAERRLVATRIPVVLVALDLRARGIVVWEGERPGEAADAAYLTEFAPREP